MQVNTSERSSTPASPVQVRQVIEAALNFRSGPGKWPRASHLSPRRIVGLLVPDAEPSVCGPVLAHAYAELIRDGHPRSFLLTAMGEVDEPMLVPSARLATSLGQAKADLDLETALGTAGITSVGEVGSAMWWMLAFLQSIWQPVQACGIVLPQVLSEENAASLATQLGNGIYGRDVVVLAAGAMTKAKTAARARYKDQLLMAPLLRLDLDGFYRVMARQQVDEQGMAPVVMLVSLAKALGAHNGHYIKYLTSEDVLGPQDDEVMGLAAIKLVA